MREERLREDRQREKEKRDKEKRRERERERKDKEKKEKDRLERERARERERKEQEKRERELKKEREKKERERKEEKERKTRERELKRQREKEELERQLREQKDKERYDNSGGEEEEGSYSGEDEQSYDSRNIKNLDDNKLREVKGIGNLLKNVKPQGTTLRDKTPLESEKDSFEEDSFEDKKRDKKNPKKTMGGQKPISNSKILQNIGSKLESLGENEKKNEELRSRISANSVAETMKKLKENTLNLKEKQKQEILIDGEMEELKKEIEKLDSEISILKNREIKKTLVKSITNPNERKIKEILLKQDKDIKKYKEAYMHLLSRWENAMLDKKNKDISFKPKLDDRKYKLNLKSSNIEDMNRSTYINQMRTSEKKDENENLYVSKYLSKIGDIESQSNAESIGSRIQNKFENHRAKRSQSGFVNSNKIPRKKVFVNDFDNDVLGRYKNLNSVPNHFGGMRRPEFETPVKRSDIGMKNRQNPVQRALEDYRAGNSEFRRKYDELRGSRYMG